MEPIVQVSLDMETIEEALELAEIAVRAGVDWLEAGTPLIMSEGMAAVRALKERFPDHPLVADLKITDGAYLETLMAAQAGADMVVVMGVAHPATVRATVRAAREAGIKVMGDIMAAPDKVACARMLEENGCDYIIVHTGYDERHEETSLSPFDDLDAVVAAVNVPVQAVGGLSIAGLYQPEVEFIQSSCREEASVGDRILVTYASRTGFAGEVADTIAKALCEAGAAADVRLAKDVKDLTPYRAAVVGSAIYMGRWMGDATRFVEKNAAALGQMPVAYFNVCLTMKDDTEENRATVAAYVDPLRQAVPGVKPVDVGLFAGGLRPKKLPWLYRFIITRMGEAEGDHRDEGAIHAWASGLLPALSA